MLQKQAKLGVSLIDYFYCVTYVVFNPEKIFQNNNIGVVDWLGRVNLRTTVAIVTHLMMQIGGTPE